MVIALYLLLPASKICATASLGSHTWRRTQHNLDRLFGDRDAERFVEVLQCEAMGYQQGKLRGYGGDQRLAGLPRPGRVGSHADELLFPGRDGVGRDRGRRMGQPQEADPAALTC